MSDITRVIIASKSSSSRAAVSKSQEKRLLRATSVSGLEVANELIEESGNLKGLNHHICVAEHW